MRWIRLYGEIFGKENPRRKEFDVTEIFFNWTWRGKFFLV
jgi:hypothetical protein